MCISESWCQWSADRAAQWLWLNKNRKAMVEHCSGGLQLCHSSHFAARNVQPLSPRSLLFSPSCLFVFCPTSHSAITEQKEAGLGGINSEGNNTQSHTQRGVATSLSPNRGFKPNTGTEGFLLLSHFGLCLCVCVTLPSLCFILGFFVCFISACVTPICFCQSHFGSILVFCPCVCVCVCRSIFAASFEMLVGLCESVHVCYMRARRHTLVCPLCVSLSLFAL